MVRSSLTSRLLHDLRGTSNRPSQMDTCVRDDSAKLEADVWQHAAGRSILYPNGTVY
jgi:hypothetical protein